MAESTTTIFFITGTTRGLAVAEQHPGRVELVEYVAGDAPGNAALAQQIQSTHGRVDVVIANAAMCGGLAPVHAVDIAQYQDHFSVNVTGPIILFQAFYHLLKASAHPKFVPITSVGGSLAVTTPLPLRSTCYCSSKAMLNWVPRKIHFENEWLVCFPLAPGSVDTDMRKLVQTLEINTLTYDTTHYMAEYVDREGSRSPGAAASALIDIVVGATRESEGGQFVDVDGSRLPW
ncbi:hypothetical protein BJ912DRAFT_1024288 [Pholiota molesta]|nr:hypothetical protein BJ912DRAFT_1024288 [Pholiota molesta]